MISHADRHADPLIFFLIVKVSPPDTTLHLIDTGMSPSCFMTRLYDAIINEDITRYS
jgi:hypothetical protein